MQHKESAKPKQNQYYSQNEKHEMTYFLRTDWRTGRLMYQVIGAEVLWNRCSVREDSQNGSLLAGCPEGPPYCPRVNSCDSISYEVPLSAKYS